MLEPMMGINSHPIYNIKFTLFFNIAPINCASRNLSNRKYK